MITDGFIFHLLKRQSYRNILSALFICLLIFSNIKHVYADEEHPIEEISVFFNFSGFDGAELPAVIIGESAYLSIKDLFDYLRIKNELTSDGNSVRGYFLDQDAKYVIDKQANSIYFKGKLSKLSNKDLVLTPSGLYLKADIFGKIFGLNCAFNFRSLSIILKTNLELPVIREKRLELMRNNMNKLKWEGKADTIIPRQFTAFNLGSVDWSVASIQQEAGVKNASLGLTLGSVIAGGETTISLNHITGRSFNSRRQHYLWRYVNSDHSMFRQIKAGRIQSQFTSSILGSLVGVQVTNTPVTLRRSFDSYTLSNYTEPGWTVELYVNNVLLDYVKADASGFYDFNVPLMYGNSLVKLKFYGLYGEEKQLEQNINLPYNFLPPKEMEYTLSGGIVEDGKQSRFSRLDVKYGFNRSITIGGGVEYLSTLSSAKMLPFINSSFRLASNLLLSADYTYGVRAKSILNYRVLGDVMFELNYTAYQKGQQAIKLDYREERKASLSIPVRGKNFSMFSRIILNQIVFDNEKQTTGELVFSGITGGINTNLTTQFFSTSQGYSNIYSDLSMAFRLPRDLLLRPQIQFDYKSRQINTYKMEVEKSIFKRAYLNLSYIGNPVSNVKSIDLGLRFDLSYAKTAFSARQSNNRSTFMQSARGGMIFDEGTKQVSFNNQSNASKGGLIIYPFIDLNSNGRREREEPKVEGLKFKNNIGLTTFNHNDSTIHIENLQPYLNYLLEIDPSSFSDISWKVKNKVIQVSIEPNKQKVLEIPVNVVAEVAGTVYLKKSGVTEGVGRIWICFYDKYGKLVARTLSESDGYFTYLGLTPGVYSVDIDPKQLSKLGMASSAPISFVVKSGIHGDVIDYLEFTIIYQQQKDVRDKPSIPLALEEILIRLQ